MFLLKMNRSKNNKKKVLIESYVERGKQGFKGYSKEN